VDRVSFTDALPQGLLFILSKRSHPKRPTLSATTFDVWKKWVRFNLCILIELNVIYRVCLQSIFVADNFGPKPKICCDYTQRFEQSPVSKLAAKTTQIINTVFPGIEPVHQNVLIILDLEAPRLGVVSARRPPRQLQNFLDNAWHSNPPMNRLCTKDTRCTPIVPPHGGQTLMVLVPTEKLVNYS
jgi:hypothetical protein